MHLRALLEPANTAAAAPSAHAKGKRKAQSDDPNFSLPLEEFLAAEMRKFSAIDASNRGPPGSSAPSTSTEGRDAKRLKQKQAIEPVPNQAGPAESSDTDAAITMAVPQIAEVTPLARDVE